VWAAALAALCFGPCWSATRRPARGGGIGQGTPSKRDGGVAAEHSALSVSRGGGAVCDAAAAVRVVPPQANATVDPR
jgi:hypothetical protein